MGRLLLLVVAMGIVSVSVSAAPPAEATSPDVATRCVIDQGDFLMAEGVTLDVEASTGEDPSAPIRFTCSIRTQTYMPEAWLRIRVSDQTGQVLHETPLDLPVQPGLTRGLFEWAPTTIPYGVLLARFELLRKPQSLVCWRELVISKLSQDRLGRDIEGTIQAASELKAHIDSTTANGASAPYAQMRVALARHFAELARVAMGRGDWRRAGYYARYAADTVTAVRAQLTFSKNLPELHTPLDSPHVSRLTRKNGSYYAGERPVFLLGGRGGQDLLDVLPYFRDYGLNFAAFDVPPSGFAHSVARQALDRAVSANVAVSLMIDPFEMRDSNDTASASIDLLDRNVRLGVERQVRDVAAQVRGLPMLQGLTLAQEPAFQFSGDAVRAGFIAYVKQNYHEIELLNRVWKARFGDYDDIEVSFSPGTYGYHLNAGFQYDWQRYQQWMGTQFLGLMKEWANQAAPGLPVGIQVSAQVLAPGESQYGIDREALSRLMDFSSAAVADRPSQGVYALEYPRSSLLYTLLRSFDPSKPVVNTKHDLLDAATPFATNAYNYVHSVMWESAISGLDASALWTWEHDATRTGIQGTILDRPECLEAYATACLDLNRLGPIVQAFQQAKGDVAILWSMPSKIFQNGDPYLASVASAYEGCSFSGKHVRFITEDQILQHGLADVTVLVLPDTPAMGDQLTFETRHAFSDAVFDTIESFAVAGGIVVRPGTPMPYNARGGSRQDVFSQTARTILVRGTNSANDYLAAMDAAFSTGGLDPVPRVINEFGYPLEGVRSLYLELGGRGYLYVLNIRKTAVRCELHGVYTSGRDLIKGRTVTFPQVVQPLDPMLILLDDVDLATKLPTAKVGEPPVAEQRHVEFSEIRRGAVRNK